MGKFLGNLFGSVKEEAGPSEEELAAQKKEKALVDIKARGEASERTERSRIITARAAGPQTLFTRPGSIPRAVRLGGGQR